MRGRIVKGEKVGGKKELRIDWKRRREDKKGEYRKGEKKSIVYNL